MEETDMEGPISIKEILAQLDGEFPMDEAVMEGDYVLIITKLPQHTLTSTVALPQGTTFLSVERFGTSAYTITGRVMAQEPDATEKPYFLKVCSTAPFAKNESRNTNETGL
jgi:protein-ribulosamine 3-kinase